MESNAIAAIISAVVAGLVATAGHYWLYKGKREDTEVSAQAQFMTALMSRLEAVEAKLDEALAERDIDALHRQMLVDHIYRQKPPPPPERPTKTTT